MSLYLAIDAGGTRTRCLLADDHRVLARASTGTVKLMRVSEEEATRRLQGILEQVTEAAGVSLERVTRTCLGLAGVGTPVARTWARQILPAMVAGEFVLCGDEEIALDAAFGDGPGILVIAGTGSNVVGRCATGTRFSAGGWGPVLGDEGSGFWIGLEALRAALRARDTAAASEPTGLLLESIRRHWGLATLGDLVAAANMRANTDRPAPDFAAFAPVVAACAEEGDAVALRVLNRAGEELARQVALVYAKMIASGCTPDSGVEVAFTGSVLARIAAVRDAMVSKLAAAVPAAVCRIEEVDPLEGALYRARHR
jgi:glucosamine kinase